MAPLLAELMRRYVQTGLPPPYLAFDDPADSSAVVTTLLPTEERHK
jgi:hypothetical protein